MKRTFKMMVSVVTVLMCMLALVPVSAEGTDEEVIPIYTIEDLYCIRDNMTASYILMNDIDLTSATAEGGDWDFEGRGWNPIGSDDIYAADKTFSGVFDGNGHSIIGMQIRTEPLPRSSVPYVGLFSNISGEVKNLNLEDCNVSGSSVGILASINSGTITNCTVGGEVSGGYAGGLVDRNTGIILNCSSSANIKVFLRSDSESFVCKTGGIVADNECDEEGMGVIQNCFNNGQICVSVYSDAVKAYAGGIVGVNTKGTISQCYNNGHIEAKTSAIPLSPSDSSRRVCYAGGIAGVSSGKTEAIADSYNTGDVSATPNNSFAGGIVGTYSSTFSKLRNCYNIGNISMGTYSGSKISGYGITNGGSLENCYYLSGNGSGANGATALTSAQMKLTSMFRGFDFDTVWVQNKNAEYPYPQLQSIPQNMNESIEEISIPFLPEKLLYYCGEELDLTGGVIQITYTSGDTKQMPLSVDMVDGYDSGCIGTQTLTVTYKEFTATFDIEVSKKPVATEIVLKSEPDNTKYVKGTKFDLSGAEISVIYDNGDEKAVAVDDSMISGGDINTLGEQDLTISYEGLSLTIKVEVISVEVEKLELTELPAKLVYLEGEEFDDAGMVITAYYNNGENAVISSSEYTVIGYSASPGVHSVTIEYSSKTVSFNVTVKNKTLSEISVAQLPDKTEYIEGEELELKGLIINAIYDNGDIEPITDYEYSGYTSSVGEKTIIVTYGGKSVTFLVTVEAIDEDTPIIKAESAKGKAGQTVDVKIMVKNNPGAALMSFELNYDKNAMTLKNATLGEIFTGDLDCNLNRVPFVFTVYAGQGNKTNDGLLVTLTFEIAEDCAEGEYALEISAIDCLNLDEEAVNYVPVNGKITVNNVIPGDVTGDGVVTRSDLLRLAKYFSGFEVEIDSAAADVTGDGEVTRSDLLRLAKYFSGFDVKLGK